MAASMKGGFDPYIATMQNLVFAKEIGLSTFTTWRVILLKLSRLLLVNMFFLKRVLYLTTLDVFWLMYVMYFLFCPLNVNKEYHSLVRFALSLASPMYVLEENHECISHIVASNLLASS
ncbi:hypothetical protein PanWU01x14_369190 [Parasponia andersonii]|uniref:Transmembrane protein n=1 Tax=Parasponia andersonii TaxID=3476 RepID=A0A2P5A4T2_PARAD|nr:hypothetical protein PanWU01x14_369190 [Parasponia andersonii]